MPIDIQCGSQAIDALVSFHDRDPERVASALNVANWTIEHMQDGSGYFYYRRYSRSLVKKTPTLLPTSLKSGNARDQHPTNFPEATSSLLTQIHFRA